jgi:hypothetical protein
MPVPTIQTSAGQAPVTTILPSSSGSIPRNTNVGVNPPSSQGSSSAIQVRTGGTAASQRRQPDTLHRFLELCVNTGKFQTSLQEIALSHTVCDGDLFRQIRENYNAARGFRAKSYFLLEPTTLRYVQVSSSFLVT